MTGVFDGNGSRKLAPRRRHCQPALCGGKMQAPLGFFHPLAWLGSTFTDALVEHDVCSSAKF
jgi:hypothetical protein